MSSKGSVEKLQAVVDVKEDELRSLLLATLAFFCLLFGYFTIRPLRDEMGTRIGRDGLAYMFSFTFMGMLVLVPLYGALIKRWSRATFLPFIYHFFALCLLIFYVTAIAGRGFSLLMAKVFFVWASIYAVFVVSVFWSFLTDIHSASQSKRLFPFIAFGGSAGALAGSSVTSFLAPRIDIAHLLLIPLVLLELAMWCNQRLMREATKTQRLAESKAASVIGGSIMAGIKTTLASPFLVGICCFLLLRSFCDTIIYLQLNSYVKETYPLDEAARTQLFANVDLIVQCGTIFLELFVTARLLKYFGLKLVVVLLPLACLVGFGFLALVPSLFVIIALSITARILKYGSSDPTRRILFTKLNDEKKYKSQNFIDTAVYRGGDTLSIWLQRGLEGLGLSLPQIAATGIPLALIWAIVAKKLALKHDRDDC